MFRRIINIVLAMTIFTVVFQGHAWALTNGIGDGVYDFGGLGVDDSLGLGTGYAKLGDKFKVRNNQIGPWFSVNDILNVPSTAFTSLSSDTSSSTVVIKAEGGALCKTFTFKDIGISAYKTFQKFGSFKIELYNIDGGLIGAPIILGQGGPSDVYPTTSVTQISDLYNLGSQWSVDGVASIEITFTLLEDDNPANASDLNFENITIANVDATASKPGVFGVYPSSGPVSGGTTVTITGADFTGATNVIFGSASPVIANFVSSTQITATTPEFSTPSTVGIRVTTLSETSDISASEPVQFTFNNAAGTEDGTYDFGSLGATDSAETGYARLGDKFKVGNYRYAEWQSLNTGPYTAIYPNSSTITLPDSPADITIKAEGGSVCNTFTFKDLGISATNPDQKFESFDILLRGIDGSVLYSKSLGSSDVFNTDVVTNIRGLYYLQDLWSVDGIADVAFIEIAYSISANASPAKAWDLNLENITVANVKGKSYQTITFGPIPTIDPGTGTGTVSALSFSGLTPTVLPITFVSTTTGVCTVTGTTVTVLTGGDCIITASQDGNASFFAAPQVTQNFSKSNQTINFGVVPTVTVGNIGTVSATASSGLTAITFSSKTPKICSVSVATVTGITAGKCIIAANQAGDSTYNAAPQVTQDITVGKGSQTISFIAPATATYSDAITLSATVSPSGLPVSFALVSGPATMPPGGNTLTITGVGPIVVRASQSGTTNYSAATDVPQTIAVAAKPLVITSNSASRAFSVANPATPGFTAPALAIGDAISSVTYTYAATADAAANVGTNHSITPSAAVFSAGSATNYTITYVAGTLTIAGTASQTISFNPPVTATYGDAPITLTATAVPSGLPVSFTLVSGPATLPSGGNTLTITGVGNIVVRASQMGGTDYSSATDVTKTITVKVNQTITFTTPDVQSFGKSLTLSATSTSGLPPSFTSSTIDVCTITSEVILTFVSAGTCTINADQLGNVDFNAASRVIQNFMVKADQIITFTKPLDQIFGTNPMLFATASSGLTPAFGSSTTGACTVTPGGALTFVTAGICTIVAKQGGNGNYNAAPQVTQTFTVVKATPVITWSNPVDITYGTALSATQLNATASVAGTFAYTPASGTTLSAGAGQALSVSFIPTDTTNYTTPVAAAAAISVTKATPTITFTAPANKIYGDAPITLSATATSGLPVSFTLVNGPATLVGTTLTITGTGSIVVKATQGGDSNFSAAPDITQTITVTRYPVVLGDALNAYYIYLGMKLSTAIDLARYDLAPLDANGKPKGNGKIDIGDVVFMLRNLVGW